MTDKPSSVKELANLLNRELGMDAIKMASEVEGTFFLRRPSGIFSLDLATGGGLPAGTMVKIGGQEGLGKNYLADCYMSQCQKIYGKAAKIFILSSEYPYDKLRGRQNGVRIALTKDEISRLESSLKRKLDPDEKKELRSETGEFALAHGLSMEDSLGTVLKCLESDLFHIVVLDSMDALLPAVQEDRDLDDPKVAASAIVQSSFMRKFYKAIGRTRKTLLLTLGQARANIPAAGTRVFKTVKVNDPWAVKHGQAGKIVLSPGGPIRESKKVVGKVINWQIEKGKAGFHDGPTGSFNFHYGSGIDKLVDFVEIAKTYMERKGAYYINPLLGGDEKIHGVDGLLKYFSDQAERQRFEEYIYSTENIACIHHEEVKAKASSQGRSKAGKKAKGKNNP